MIEAYPLHWPPDWPRTPAHQRESDGRFGGARKLTMGRAISQLVDEVRLLRATNLIVSSNIPTKGNGLPYAEAKRVDDPGVSVWFDFMGKPGVVARDGFTSPAGNIRSMTLMIEGFRQVERHGGSLMLERAFTGFIAIAPPNWKKPWREVFGVKGDWAGNITALYREKARERHPDTGGHETLMAELNVAYQEARQELGALPCPVTLDLLDWP
jgi:hypothetical protein